MDAETAWKKAGEHILNKGYVVSPRGESTLEDMGSIVKISGRLPIVTNLYRKLNYQFMFAEAAWILTGDNRASTLTPYIKSYDKYAVPETDRIAWAYGPKYVDQLPYVIDSLRQDITTRRALISIWRESSKFDPSCTISLHFLHRFNELQLIVHMRSSDVWMGLPYDMFSFGMVLAHVAITMRLKIGQVTIMAGSQHLYKGNLQHMELALRPGVNREYTPMCLNDFNTPDELVCHLVHLRNAQSDRLKSKTFSEMIQA